MLFQKEALLLYVRSIPKCSFMEPASIYFFPFLRSPVFAFLASIRSVVRSIFKKNDKMNKSWFSTFGTPLFFFGGDFPVRIPVCHILALAWVLKRKQKSQKWVAFFF